MRLKRTEWLGGTTGRVYEIDTDDERIVTELEGLKALDAEDKERCIDNQLDSFADGYNQLKMIDGIWYEVQKTEDLEIKRKAYVEAV